VENSPGHLPLPGYRGDSENDYRANIERATNYGRIIPETSVVANLLFPGVAVDRPNDEIFKSR
jgi:hypothetical protein